MEFLLLGFCVSGSCCCFVVEMIHWNSSDSAVCALTNCLEEVLACYCRIQCTFQIDVAVLSVYVCLCVSANMHECMLASYYMELAFEPAERSYFIDFNLCCTPFLATRKQPQLFYMDCSV